MMYHQRKYCQPHFCMLDSCFFFIIKKENGEWSGKIYVRIAAMLGVSISYFKDFSSLFVCQYSREQISTRTLEGQISCLCFSNDHSLCACPSRKLRLKLPFYVMPLGLLPVSEL